MLLRLTCSLADWARLAATLETTGSPILANVVRAGLAFGRRSVTGEAMALDFTPQQAGAVQLAAADLGLSLPATPIAEQSGALGWVTSAAERAEAVAAAEAIVRAHQRHRAA